MTYTETIKHLLEQLQKYLSTDLSRENVIARLSARYERIHNAVVEEFGINGLYILAAFVFFLILIIFIYIKSVVDTFRTTRVLEETNEENEGLFYTYGENAADSEEGANEREKQHNDLPMIDMQEEYADFSSEEALSRSLLAKSAVSDDILNVSRDYKELKEKMSRHAKQSQTLWSYVSNSRANVEINKTDDMSERIPLSDEQRKKREIHNLITVILDLLGRKVSVSKIAQVVFFYNQEKYSEQDVIQIIQTIRDFIGLCNAGHFDLLPQTEKIPTGKEAVYAWAHGDTTPCLTLLQAYLNMLMSQSTQEQGLMRDMTYAQAANCACIMGNIARLTDADLAHNSFELATELSPHSTNAWSNLADVYAAEHNKEKAMIAYQTVLDLGYDVMYAWQIANAQTYMSEYYENMGLDAKAEDFRELSRDFYKEYGIRQPLTIKEKAAYELINAQKEQNLMSVLDNLLARDGAFVR
ncbi:MAG: hypothetical protein IJ778_04495 [Alphaproteobacteria bacterium]|nr:hypothetical protein [Alphaproteobacteria bacterium]